MRFLQPRPFVICSAVLLVGACGPGDPLDDLPEQLDHLSLYPGFVAGEMEFSIGFPSCDEERPGIRGFLDELELTQMGIGGEKQSDNIGNTVCKEQATWVWVGPAETLFSGNAESVVTLSSDDHEIRFLVPGARQEPTLDWGGSDPWVVAPGQVLELGIVPSSQRWHDETDSPFPDESWRLMLEDDPYWFCPDSVSSCEAVTDHSPQSSTIPVPDLCLDGPAILIEPLRSLIVGCPDEMPDCISGPYGSALWQVEHEVEVVFPEGYTPSAQCPGR